MECVTGHLSEVCYQIFQARCFTNLEEASSQVSPLAFHSTIRKILKNHDLNISPCNNSVSSSGQTHMFELAEESLHPPPTSPPFPTCRARVIAKHIDPAASKPLKKDVSRLKHRVLQTIQAPKLDAHSKCGLHREELAHQGVQLPPCQV